MNQMCLCWGARTYVAGAQMSVCEGIRCAYLGVRVLALSYTGCGILERYAAGANALFCVQDTGEHASKKVKRKTLCAKYGHIHRRARTRDFQRPHTGLLDVLPGALSPVLLEGVGAGGHARELLNNALVDLVQHDGELREDPCKKGWE